MEFGGLSQSCGNAPDLAPQKQRTKPLIPEMCFTSTGCSTDINLSTPYLEEDGTSLLVSCKKCSVRVHASECLSFCLRLDPEGLSLLTASLAPCWPPSSLPVAPPGPECKDCSCVLGEFAADGVGSFTDFGCVLVRSTLCCSLGCRCQEGISSPCCSLGDCTSGPTGSDFSRPWAIVYG